MGLPCLVVALFATWLCDPAESTESFVLQVQTPVSVKLGQTAILPCWLNPPQSAVNLEVNWHFGGGGAGQADAPILLYKDKKMESPGTFYKDRVSFGLKNKESGGLEVGDISLKLMNTTTEDAGDYTCYVSSDSGYDRTAVALSVTETGAPVLLQTEWTKDNMVNVSCESGGWYPQPSLRWSDSKQVLNPKSLVYSKESSGLLTVQSSVLVTAPSEVSCSVGPSGGEMKEARVRLDKPPSTDYQNRDSDSSSSTSSVGWVLFALVLVAALALFGWQYYRKRAEKSRQNYEMTDGNERLLPKDEIVLPIEHYVNVTLDKVENPYVTIRGELMRDAACVFPDGEKVTCYTAVKGEQGFSSGQHYWEVSMTVPNAGTKQSWWLGVTTASAIPQSELIPSPSDGYWFLSSRNCFRFNTGESTVPIVRPLTVGVHLNYDKGEISFHNVEDKSLIGKLTAMFEGKEVFPLFNPGKNDKSTMKIKHKQIDQNHCAVEVENQ